MWEKDKQLISSTNTSNSKETTTITTTTSNTTNPKKFESIVNDINLNDNILVSEEHIYLSRCSNIYYIFTIKGLKDFRDLKTINRELSYFEDGVDESACKERNNEEELLNCKKEQCKQIKEKFDKAYKSFTFNEDLEIRVKEALDKLKKEKRTTVANLNYTINNHRFSFDYMYLTLKGKDIPDDFKKSYENRQKVFNTQLNTIFKKAAYINENCLDNCNIKKEASKTVLLDESLCKKYNLKCSRW